MKQLQRENRQQLKSTNYTMYGSMNIDAANATQPLLRDVGTPNAARRRSSANRPQERDTATSLRSVHRAGPVLTSILDRRGSIRAEATSNRRLQVVLEDGGSEDHGTNAEDSTNAKSFVYTMLNPRSQAWQATCFKWAITLVILSVRTHYGLLRTHKVAITSRS